MRKRKDRLQAKLFFSAQKNGLNVKLKNKVFRLTYPQSIWQNYPEKEKDFLIDNLSYLLTCTLPLVSDFKKIKYNTSYPLFKPFFEQVVIRDIPSATEDYPLSTTKTIKDFFNVELSFKNLKIKTPVYGGTVKKERIIIPLSFGKDSLLTLALAREIGLEPICIYINDTVSRIENKLKLKLVKEVSEKFGVTCFTVNNQFENLNDFEYWGNRESCVGYSHMIAGFSFLLLPFARFYKAKYIALGNQKNMDFSFVNKEEFYAFPSYDQSLEGTKQLDAIIRVATRDKVNIISLIEPLTNLAITKILHHRYPDISRIEISCDDLSALDDERRWCMKCSKCARLYILMKAWGIDTKAMEFSRELLGKNSEKFYRLFAGPSPLVGSYEKSRKARDEQLLAFYLAYKRGVKGYLMDKFKKLFLDEVKRREKSLRKDFLAIHQMETIPETLRNSLSRIYHQELN